MSLQVCCRLSRRIDLDILLLMACRSVSAHPVSNIVRLSAISCSDAVGNDMSLLSDLSS